MRDDTIRVLAVWLLVLGSTDFVAAARPERVAESPAAHVTLLELFSSEGCSSCPAADAWIGSLKRSPLLWSRIVPVVFHVDYWDDLGWGDRFATPAFTRRQRDYAAAWGSGSVYTPGFVVDGNEWKGWFRGQREVPSAGQDVGVLRVMQGESGQFDVAFMPLGPGEGTLQAHGALLGMGIASHVQAGENRGRRLQHDFLVLAYDERTMTRDGQRFTATVGMAAPSGIHPERYAVAFWVNRRGQRQPLQATGAAWSLAEP